MVLLLLPLLPPGLPAEEPSDGYRGEPYKAPTPWAAPGATTLYFADDVRALIQSTDIVLVNVSPITLGPADEEGKRLWIPRRNSPMSNIPGSVWLPNVGYQELEPGVMTYFSRNLFELTGGNYDRPLLFYCTADCWMSWNAVKRAREELGYRQVYWYPDGIDGWREQDLELEPATPVEYGMD